MSIIKRSDKHAKRRRDRTDGQRLNDRERNEVLDQIGAAEIVGVHSFLELNSKMAKG